MQIPQRMADTSTHSTTTTTMRYPITTQCLEERGREDGGRSGGEREGEEEGGEN